MNYYNEFDPKTAAWLRELIKNGAIPDGHVDERSIADVSPRDLKGYIQCHFFAGIGGWSYALQLAGWPADEPVWTGSCPCQPFSCAGKGLGTEDERHLWPVFAELIRQCQPPTVFGEQVASKAGRDWLAGVFADLEGMGYQRAGADMCAAGVGAPHIRQRLYWMAHNDKIECSQFSDTQRKGFKPGLADRSTVSRVGDTMRFRREGVDDIPCRKQAGEFESRFERGSCRLVYTNRDGCEPGSYAAPSAGHGDSAHSTGFWPDSQLIWCRDKKTRRIPTEPAFFPLAHGVPSRVVRLRGYGNAIVPQVAAKFIKASVEAIIDIA